jgi:hypothetical protein
LFLFLIVDGGILLASSSSVIVLVVIILLLATLLGAVVVYSRSRRRQEAAMGASISRHGSSSPGLLMKMEAGSQSASQQAASQPASIQWYGSNVKNEQTLLVHFFSPATSSARGSNGMQLMDREPRAGASAGRQALTIRFFQNSNS